jgi:hypothetical protein
MAWNREKWNKFVTDNTDPLPTDAAAIEASEEAKELAETYEEDIDLTALGVARVKTMLEELAAVTPSEQGPAGNDGSLDSAAFNGLSTPQKYTFTNTQFPVGSDEQSVVVRTFAAGELDGTKDTILVHFSTFGINAIKAYWTPTGESQVQIIGGAGGLTSVLGGMTQLFINEVPDVTNGPFLRSRSSSVVVGAATITTQGTAQIIDGGGSGIANWMAHGGTLEISIISAATSQTFGILV